jgi:hypothetical protein
MIENLEQLPPRNKINKITLGLRVHPDHKLKLSEEAGRLGISLSERAENLLLRGEIEMAEKEKAIVELKILQKHIRELTENAHRSKEKSTEAMSKLISENGSLKERTLELETQNGIFKNERLLYLFEKLKGTNYKIDLPGGRQIKIVFETPLDLLTAIIYSFNIKKP